MSEQKLPISARLRCCAEQVPQGARVADVGADHGYLGIELLRSGRCAFVHASDLRAQPLQRARENARRFGTLERMRFSQADGLAAVAPASVDTVLCAGMGGDLIARIVENAPWLRDPRYLLILQPQSSGNDLRRRLAELGFAIERETLVEDGGFLYFVLCARYRAPYALTPGQQYASPTLLASGSPLLPRYLARIEHALHLTVAGIGQSKRPDAPQRLAYYQAALDEIRQFIEQEQHT